MTSIVTKCPTLSLIVGLKVVKLVYVLSSTYNGLTTLLRLQKHTLLRGH